METERLKPCPFCGNEKTTKVITGKAKLGLYSVVCSMPIGGCGASSGIAISAEEAIRNWNTRVGS